MDFNDLEVQFKTGVKMMILCSLITLLAGMDKKRVTTCS